MPVIVNPGAAAPSVPFAHPTLAEAVGLVRQDIFDAVGNVPPGTGQRFTDSDLQRALDRAIDEYSFFSSYFQQVEIATFAGVRTYPLPAGVWWIDTVEYPTGQYPRQYVDFYEQWTPSISPPPYGSFAGGVQQGLPTLSDGGVAVPGPGLGGGAYRYTCTYVTPGGETPGSAEVGPFVVTAGHAVTISGLPTGPLGAVNARNVYRTAVGGAPGSEKLALQVADNVTTTVLDTVPDASLGVVQPTVNTTGGIKAVTLKISQALLPADTSGLITLQTASKHVLAASGTTVPEWHRDAVVLGAAAYALLAYQVPTNDFFEYQDGEMRDRVDQTKVAGQWLAAGKALLDRFKARLELIKREANASQAARVSWGDKPARWDRI